MQLKGCVRLSLLYLFIFLFATILSSQTGHAQEAILQVRVNAVNKGDFFILLTPDGDVLLKAQDLERLDVKDLRLLTEIEGITYVSLRAYAPLLSYKINEVESSLEITADPQLLAERELELEVRRSRPPVAKDSSAFWNYGATFSTSEGLRNFGDFNLSSEIGLRLKDYLGLSTFAYDQEHGLVRLSNAVITDDLASLRRFVIGDTTGVSGALGSGVLLGGLSVSKEFALDPYFIEFPTPDLQLLLATPSEVQIFQNGMLLRTERLAPGRILLQNIPGATTGLGQLDVIVRDAFGREQRLTRPFYFSERLLKEGVHDYSYSVGFVREAFGTRSFAYREPAFLALHNIGISDSVNTGFTAEISRDLINFGPTAVLRLPRAGVINLATSFSSFKGQWGLAGLINYGFASRKFSTNLLLRLYSTDYFNLNFVEITNKPELEARLSVGFHHPPFGSIVGELSAVKLRHESSRRGIAVSYSRRITNHTSLFVQANWITGSQASTAFFAGLHFYLGGRVSGNINHNSRDGEHREALQLQKSVPEYTGFGYRVFAEQVFPEDSAARTDGAVFVQYNGPYGRYSGQLQNINHEASGLFNVAGSVVALGGSVHLSRPVDESFALVRARGLRGVGVRFNNQLVGTTDGHGELLLPNLLSYQDNTIEIESRDVPINYDIGSLSASVSPLFRSGAVVDFTLKKLQGFYGRISLIADDQEVEIEFGKLAFKVGERSVEVPIGRGGEFYLENISPGRYTGEAKVKTKRCGIDLLIPKSTEVLVDLGTVACH